MIANVELYVEMLDFYMMWGLDLIAFKAFLQMVWHFEESVTRHMILKHMTFM
jgi:hypothetical protein